MACRSQHPGPPPCRPGGGAVRDLRRRHGGQPVKELLAGGHANRQRLCVQLPRPKRAEGKCAAPAFLEFPGVLEKRDQHTAQQVDRGGLAADSALPWRHGIVWRDGTGWVPLEAAGEASVAAVTGHQARGLRATQACSLLAPGPEVRSACGRALLPAVPRARILPASSRPVCACVPPGAPGCVCVVSSTPVLQGPLEDRLPCTAPADLTHSPPLRLTSPPALHLVTVTASRAREVPTLHTQPDGLSEPLPGCCGAAPVLTSPVRERGAAAQTSQPSCPDHAGTALGRPPGARADALERPGVMP